MAEHEPAISALQTLVDNNRRSKHVLADAIHSEPRIVTLVALLFAAIPSVGFADGREIPTRPPATKKEAQTISGLLVDIGLWKLLPHASRVHDMTRIALIANDAQRRRFRRRRQLTARIDALVRKAATQASHALGAAVDVRRNSLHVAADHHTPNIPALSRQIDYLITIDGIARIAVATVFQALSGGRQQRDLSLTYPALQAELRQISLSLILIADGRGIRDAPDRVLQILFDAVGACMTLKQAESGKLAESLASLGTAPKVQSLDARTTARIIENALLTSVAVNARDLPLDDAEARLAVARYAADHPDLALTLSQLGASLTWQRKELVARVIALREQYHPAGVTAVLGSLLEAEHIETSLDTHTPEVNMAILHLPDDPVLPRKLLVASTSEGLAASDIRMISQQALRHTPESKIAVLALPTIPHRRDDIDLASLQRTLSANVIRLDIQDLWNMATRSTAPRDNLAVNILHQSDLTKVSPFVLHSTAPERIYYGRDVEEATLVATLSTNSVAVLGGRRIGKTSLLHHVRKQLDGAGFAPYFGDCQTVRSWADFARLSARMWNIDVPRDFKPDDLMELANRLKRRSGKSVVLLLDEVDQLLSWDERHSEDQVPEAFFRACRTISQEGTAQFVFSGERMIARKLWDPHSPHWNFCRPLALRQLTNEAAERLLIEPLGSLQVAVSDVDDFVESAWCITTGHPQLVQTIGDHLVRLLNDRPPAARNSIALEDLKRVTNSFEFAEHYLETYWGQATPKERLISLAVVGGVTSISAVREFLTNRQVSLGPMEEREALRMLELYGIIDQDGPGLSVRAGWFRTALEHYGGLDQTLRRFSDRT